VSPVKYQLGFYIPENGIRQVTTVNASDLTLNQFLMERELYFATQKVVTKINIAI
jgi:hypothetical protein